MTIHQQIKDKYIQQVDCYEWDDKSLVTQYINALLKPIISFDTEKSIDESDVFSSRFGGVPIAPKHFKWPRLEYGENAPLSFFCQINCEELAGFDSHVPPPSSGLLSFFVGVSDDAMYDPECKSALKVVYFKSIEGLVPMELPSDLPEEQCLSASRIKFRHSFQMPVGLMLNEAIYAIVDSCELGELGELSDDDFDGIVQVAEEVLNDGQVKNWQCETSASLEGIEAPSEALSMYKLFTLDSVLGFPFSNSVEEAWASDVFGNEEKSENCVVLFSFRMKADHGMAFDHNDADVYICIDKSDLASEKFKTLRAYIQTS